MGGKGEWAGKTERGSKQSRMIVIHRTKLYQHCTKLLPHLVYGFAFGGPKEINQLDLGLHLKFGSFVFT